MYFFCTFFILQFARGDLLYAGTHSQKSKETYYSVKRDLLQCQKRPPTVSKETYYSVKRDLLQCQKRPTTVSKETYYSVKRDLLQCQKRPTTCLLYAGTEDGATLVQLSGKEISLSVCLELLSVAHEQVSIHISYFIAFADFTCCTWWSHTLLSLLMCVTNCSLWPTNRCRK